MPAKIINGKILAENLLNNIKKEINLLAINNQRSPTLAVILVGDDPASNIYVTNKQKAAKKIGIKSLLFKYDANISEQELLKKIIELNNNHDINGILVQLPLPKHINSSIVTKTIHYTKDVDGFNLFNIGALALRMPILRPCTPAGIVDLIKYTQIPTKGLEITIIGASNIVGRPMLLEALLLGATPTICHKFSKNIEQHVRKADCVIVAVGKPNLIKGEWIKPGALVIDVGINRLDNGQLIGDVEFAAAYDKASWITPVPGGVGPMTVAKLMENTLIAYKLQQHQE